jgi:hypothetical protein
VVCHELVARRLHHRWHRADPPTLVRATVVWVILGGDGVTMVPLLAGVTAQAIIDVRRAPKRRAEKT